VAPHGHLGYVADGQLYVVGRMGEKIIVRGRNYYAEDIEAVVEALPGMRRGGTVAFGLAGKATEELVVAAELDEGNAPAPPREAERSIREAVGRHFSLIPASVVLLPARTIGKTSSGKKRRNEFRDAYLAQVAQ
jgi:acyl-CoA synthetase (AMP-forming)/AMP-acid ligase II